MKDLRWHRWLVTLNCTTQVIFQCSGHCTQVSYGRSRYPATMQYTFRDYEVNLAITFYGLQSTIFSRTRHYSLSVMLSCNIQYLGYRLEYRYFCSPWTHYNYTELFHCSVNMVNAVEHGTTVQYMCLIMDTATAASECFSQLN